MQIKIVWKNWIAVLASVPLIIPTWTSSASAVERTISTPSTFSKSGLSTIDAAIRPQDVVLHSGNLLAGEVSDSNGHPLADTQVSVFVGKQEVAQGKTNQDGEFVIAVPRGGVYGIACGESIAVARTWSAKASPPAAESRVRLSPLSTRPTIRGQSPGFEPWYAGSGPFGLSLLGAAAIVGVATAIAVPIALNQNDNKSKSSNADPAQLPPASP